MTLHYFGDNEIAKEIKLSAGDVVVQHKHTYSHISILASGTVKLSDGEDNQVLTGPCALVIQKEKYHSIAALTDAVWYCIHGCDGQNYSDDVVISKNSSAEECKQIGMAL
jgi:hypothetical protein